MKQEEKDFKNFNLENRDHFIFVASHFIPASFNTNYINLNLIIYNLINKSQFLYLS